MKKTVAFPQFLQHRLKAYGLTGRQFLILLVGAVISASCWQSLSPTQRPLAIGTTIVSLVITSAVAFVRISGRMLEEWLVIILIWSIQSERLEGKTFQRVFHRIKSLGDKGIVQIERGGYLAMIQVEGCFSEQLLEDEQGVFIEAFTEFLTGLTFPLSIQVRMRLPARQKSIVPSPRLPNALRRLHAHYLSFLYEQIQAHPPRSITCSVILSAGKADQCFEYAKSVLAGLQKMSLLCHQLSSDEIATFDQENLGAGEEKTSAARLNAREVRFDSASGGHRYGAGLTITKLPGSIAMGWLARFIQQETEPYDLRLSLSPRDDQEIARQLERKAAVFGGALLVAEKGQKKGNRITQHALREVEALREQLVLKKSHIYATTLVVCVWSSHRTALRARLRNIRLLLRSLNIVVTPLYFQHHLSFLTGIHGSNLLPAYEHLLPTEAAASFYPFLQIPTLGKGVLLGTTRRGSDLVSLDLEQRMNLNLAVLGVPGSGKSFFLKLLSSRLAFSQENLSITIIDIEGEYAQWVTAVGAHQILFSADSLELNPFAFSHQQNLREKLSFLVGLVALLAGEGGTLTQHEKALVAEAVMNCYAACGISDDLATHGCTAPSMEDFLQALRQVEPTNDLIYRLEMYKSLFPRTDAADQNASPYQVFNLHDLPVELRAAAMYLIIERLSFLLQKEHQGKHIVIVDEAWFLLKFELGATFLNEFGRRARKYGVGLWVGTQQVGDLLAEHGEGFKGLLDLCETKMLFRQEVSVEKLFKLSTLEEQFLRSAGRGEALYLTSQERFMLNILASEKEKSFARGANG